ncbi:MULTISPECIES: hypothetical protein [unclassified Saccharothrix]|uniref:hypothetical protein n=1 Tax=unclassified Saccharothrix TaxID=2593673 RepID=UPI00307F1D91
MEVPALSYADQRSGPGVSRVKRLLSRALLVAGGALAGTAAVWALSTASASAQGVDHADAVTSVTESVAAGPVGGAVVPVRETVRDLDEKVRAEREHHPVPDLGRVAEDIRDTFGNTVAGFEPNPAGSVTSSSFTGRAVNRHTEPASEATAVPVSIGTPVVRGPFGKLSESWASSSAPAFDASSDEGRTSPLTDPAGPTRTPFAPPSGVPVHCSCAGDGSGTAGGGSGPFTGTTADGFDAAVLRALLPVTERLSVLPGKQPGTTPD